MKNFTKQNFKTNPLWIRLLIMGFMLLLGTSSAWAAASLMGTDFPNGNWDGGISLPCTLYLESKTYNFKVKENSTWYEDQNEGTMNPGDSWKFYNYDKGNTKLKISTAGYYTLSWNESTNTFSVVEAIATAYVVGGYYGGDKNYSSGKKLTKQSDGTYSGTFSDFSGSCYFQIYDDLGRVWGCDYVTKKVGESVTLNTSKNNKVEYSLTNGISYIFSFNPSDGTFLVKTSCTDPKAADFSYTDPKPTYDGTAKSATVKWKDDNTSTGITVKYGVSATAPTNAGTYAITVSTTAHGNICASKSDISLGDFTINKADQKALSISTDAVVCGKSVTLATSGGTGNGTVSYTLSENTANATVSNGVLSATTSGSVKVKATKSGGTNYNDATVEKTFNFTMPIENVKLAVKNTSVKASYCKDENITLVLTYDGPTPDFNNNEFEWVLSGIQTGTQFIGDGTNGINSGSEFTLQLGGVGVNKVGVKLKGCNGWVTSTDENSVNVTVNAIPNKPSLNNPNPICYGQPITLPEKDANKKTITWVGVDNRTLTGLAVGTHEYTAKIVENGCESATTTYTITVKEQLAKPVLKITNVKQCGSNYTAGKIVISNHDPNNTYILKKDGNPINKAYNDGYSVSENEKGTYTVEVSKDGACGATSDDVTIEVINNTPTVTPFEITKQANVCMGNPVTLSYDGTAQSGDISYAWYEGANNEVLGTESSLEIAQAKNTTYKLKITVTANDCSADKETTITIEPKQRPAKPTFNSDEMSVCAGQQFNLPIPNNLPDEDDVYGLWTVGGYATTQSQTLDAAEDYKYTAYINNGCPSEGTDFTVHVNPLPAITGISVNNSTPVINEDVLLTVEGSDIARVEWSITSGNNASLSDASGNSVKLTSTASGTVTVTATATSGAGCTATATKDVTFKAVENCDPITDNTKIEIWCQVTGTTTPYCHAYNIKSPNNVGFANWPGLTHTSKNGDYYIWTLDKTNGLDIDNNKVGIVFSKNSSGNNQTADITAFYVGNRYYFTYNANSDNKDTNYTKGNSEPLTTYPPLSTPAVKTVSATSEEGSGIVTFTGKVLKTGCANGDAIWVGYQYKKANEAWPTTGVTAGSGEKQLVTITKNPGSEDFTANVEGLEDVDYHFRAYIINGYNFTNGNYNQGVYYGLDKLVTVSTTKTPISNVTLNYCDENGGNVGVDPNPMCKGATAYVKLEYAGSNYSDIKWLVEGVETNLVTDKGNGVVWSYIIQGTGQLSVELRNDANKDNEGNPTWATSDKLSFTMKAEPAVPYISIDPASGIICEGSSATIKVENNPSPDCSYKLVKEGSEEEFPPYDSGDLTYTVQDVGKYYVIARHNECTAYEYTSNQVAINQIISTNANISIDPAKAETTPWEPVTITVKPDAGYTYELSYTDGNLAAVDGVRIKQNGDSYTYYIPRPTGWGEGNAVSVRTPVTYGIKAQLKVDGEATQCNNMSEASTTITLKDEEDEDCD